MDFETKIAALAAATKEDLYDVAYGGWLMKAVESAETLDDFAAAAPHYAERTAEKRGVVAGMPFIGWAEVQVRKGDQRRSLTVIDFGDRRVALDLEPKYFRERA